MVDFSKELILRLAEELGVREPAALMAVALVESQGGGFLPDGRVKILFEPHVFWRELEARKYNPAGLLSREDVRAIHGDISDILYKKWGARPYGTQAAQWSRLERARKINREAADSAASWGFGQVLGANWKLLGYLSVEDFVSRQATYDGQAEAFARFIKTNNLARHLNSRNWTAFALAYNGPGQAANNYDAKMASRYNELKTKGW